VCLQAYSAVAVGARCTVLEVAFYDAAHMGKLAAYLVMPACEQFHFQQMISVGICNVGVAQLGKFCLGPGFAGDEALVQFFVTLHPIFQQALLLGGWRTAQGQVSLVHFSVAEHGIHPFQGFGCLGKDA